jgi:hypothetical protein
MINVPQVPSTGLRIPLLEQQLTGLQSLLLLLLLAGVRMLLVTPVGIRFTLSMSIVQMLK